MSKRTASLLAWSMCALSLALAALSLLLLVLNLSHPNTHVYDFWLQDAIVAVLFPIVGAVIVSRHPKNLIGWICCLFGLLGGVRHLSSQYAIYALLAAPTSLSGGEALTWVAHFVWAPVHGLMVFLALLFPNGRLPSERWRWAAWTLGIIIPGLTIALALSSAPFVGLGPIQNPLGIWGDQVSRLLWCYCTLFLIVAAAALFVRLRHSTPIERQQIKWVIYAGAIVVVGEVFETLAYSGLDALWVRWGGFVILAVGLTSMPTAIVIAILRYRLYEIDIIINRTLVYGALTAMLAVLYFVDVVVFQEIFRALIGQTSQLAIVASTLMIAALFNPLRRRIQSFIDRRFYRRKYNARKTLEAFGSRLRDETNLERISDDLVGVVRETMQPSHISLWLYGFPSRKGSKAGVLSEPRE